MKITGIDKDLSSTELNFGDRYLTLDSVPNRSWSNIFEDKFQNHFSPNKRRVFIRNGCLVVQCPMDELQQQITLLNGIVKSVDEQLEASRLRAAQAAEEEQRLQDEQKNRANEAYGKLKFD